MTIGQILELDKMAKRFSELYASSELCGISCSIFEHNPEVQITPRGFYETFGDVEYEYKTNNRSTYVETNINGTRFFAVVNNYVPEVKHE